MKLKEIKTYYDNGKLYKHYYKDWRGRKQGKCISYYDNGQLCWKGQYENNLYEGRWEYYNRDGSLIDIECWHKDKYITEKEYKQMIIREIMS